MYVIIGSHKGGWRTQRESQSLQELKNWGRIHLKHYSIYRLRLNGQNFHNSTDRKFLIEHYNEPFWLNQGVPSTDPFLAGDAIHHNQNRHMAIQQEIRSWPLSERTRENIEALNAKVSEDKLCV